MLYEVRRLFSIQEREKAEKEAKKYKQYVVPAKERRELYSLIVKFMSNYSDKFYVYYFNPEIRKELERFAIKKDFFSVFGELKHDAVSLLSDIDKLSSSVQGQSYGLWLYFFNSKKIPVLVYEDEGNRFHILLNKKQEKDFKKFLVKNGFKADLKKWV